MPNETEPDEEDLEENEISFFKCKVCGSRSLLATSTVKVTETIEASLSCNCGQESEAATRSTRVVTLIEDRGYLCDNRHFKGEERQEIEELDREEEDEVICSKCYERSKTKLDSWEVNDRTSEEEETDFAISCDGCGREIEFGYSHPKKQGRIFLGEDDKDFNPWKTFPDPKYVDKWRDRGWIRPSS